MKDMVIVVPTRSAGGVRIKTLERLIKSWSNTSDKSDMVVCIDEDERDIYPRLEFEGLYYTIVPSGMSYCEKLNHIVPYLWDEYKVIGHLSDDHIFSSEGWEEKIGLWIEESGKGVCYGNDLLQGETLPTAPFISSNILRGLEFMCPPGLKHMYVDNFWKDLGIRLNCLKYFPDVITEHLHWSAGKSMEDDQYKEVNNLMDRDRKVFDMYREQLMVKDIEKVKKYIKDGKSNRNDGGPAL